MSPHFKFILLILAIVAAFVLSPALALADAPQMVVPADIAEACAAAGGCIYAPKAEIEKVAQQAYAAGRASVAEACRNIL